MSFVTLTFVATCELWWEAFGTATSYTVNLGAVAVVAVGCTGEPTSRKRLGQPRLDDALFSFAVQQSSFYGYTSMLPARYTQAVMVGESE